MKIAVEGCCHGELDKIYETLAYIENRDSVKVDLLLICGDFQSVRNESDLKAMAVPPKYQRMNTFYKYYSGEKKAPVLTIFIGGNHEASNYLQELPYGGWVAPDIYYMGYAGVIRYRGLRIGGLSGIYKPRDYTRGHFEHPPYNDDTKRSCYHIRNIDVFRLKQVKQHIDIFISHDWPRGIYHFGDTDSLIRRKRFLADEIASGTLGSMPAEELLYHIKPDYWFSAHLHVKFAAVVNHELQDGATKQTKFLSLDKCLPKRHFLQILDVGVGPHKDSEPESHGLELDPEWLCILRSTNHLMRLTNTNTYMPGPGGTDRYDFSATDSELESLAADFGGLFKIPDNFSATVTAYCPSSMSGGAHHNHNRIAAPQIKINPQTTLLCDMLGITDPFAVFSGRQPFNGTVHVDHQPAPGGFDDDDTNDSLDVDDRDEGILDDSDCIDTTFETSSSSFVGAESANVTYNPDEISLDDDDDEGPRASGDPCVEPPVKRLSLSPCCRDVNLDGRDDRVNELCQSDLVGEHSAVKGCEQDAVADRSELNNDMLSSSNDVESTSMPDVNESQSISNVRLTPGNEGMNRLKRRNLAIYAEKNSDSSDES